MGRPPAQFFAGAAQQLTTVLRKSTSSITTPDPRACRHKTLRSAVLAIRLDKRLFAQMPPDYPQAAQRALDSFAHAWVFDPSSECLSACLLFVHHRWPACTHKALKSTGSLSVAVLSSHT